MKNLDIPCAQPSPGQISALQAATYSTPLEFPKEAGSVSQFYKVAFLTRRVLMKTGDRFSRCGTLSVLLGGLLSIGGTASGQNIFFSDYYGNGSIYRYEPTGPLPVFASGLPYIDAMIFDKSGTLFLTEFNAGQIISITPDGTQSVFASGLVHPGGLAFDASGNLYVGEGGSGSILKYTTNGIRSTYATGLSPSGIAFDSSGNLFVGNHSTIMEIAPNGTQSVFASGFNNASALVFDSSGNLFAGATTTNAVVLKITPDGAISTFATRVFPGGLTFDDHGNLWIASISGIYEYAPNGTGGALISDGVKYSGIAFQAPEPSALGLLSIGSLALLWSRRRSRLVTTGLSGRNAASLVPSAFSR